MMVKPENISPDEVAPEETAEVVTSGKSANTRTKANYPRVSEMVNLAIKALCEKNGSSLQAIKKYMVETYKIDVEKQNLFIKKYLKSAVDAGFLIRTRGRGAAGSFKIPRHEIDPLKAVVKPKAKKRTAPKKKNVETSPKKNITMNSDGKKSSQSKAKKKVIPPKGKTTAQKK
ncbi:histone H1C-like [Fopius arisanus]|uniref:Histone H1C-like n=1 Tax=Fopius arisanus TaxID=64838 RepID=A0A9R1U815_9HYME|nr:PREDICTED: histone H1C-like [Fopius arisanus]